jgi:transposase-like protein
MRGKRHNDDVKAKVVAALLAGTGVMEAAREFDVPHPTVSRYRSEIPADKLDELGRKKGERLDDLLYGYLTATLQALTRQAEAAWRARHGGGGDPDRPALPAPRATEGQE